MKTFNRSFSNNLRFAIVSICLILLSLTICGAQEKVGINIANPQQILHVDGPLRLGQTTTGKIEFIGREHPNATIYSTIASVDSITQLDGPFKDDLLISASGGIFLNLDDNNNGISGPLHFSVFNNENLLLNLKENGNLGLGVLEPTSQLHVNGTSRITSTARFEGNVGIGFENPSQKLQVSGNSVITGKLRLGSTILPDQALDVSGNALISSKLGVGTTDLSTISNGKIYAGAGHFVVGNNYGFVSINGSGTGIGAGFDTDPSDNLFFFAGGDERVKIDASGNMVIGGVFPSENGADGYKLSVVGKIMSTGVRVQTTSAWPDYVFDSDYKLKDFNELQKYLDEEHHLPGFQPAQVMEMEGIDVEMMTVQQQEWIEVNTVYILQLNERISELESLVEKLLNEKK